MNDNRNAPSKEADETRNKPGDSAASGDEGSAGDRTERQPSNLPARGSAPHRAPQGALVGQAAGNPSPAQLEPGLATILGQIAALNWEISGNVRVTSQQEQILRQPVDPDWVEIKYPDVPYLPVAYYRKILNDAFGPMGWTLVEVGKANKLNEIYYLPCVLIVEGKPVAKAIGECEIKGNNTKLTDGDAIEACRSNAITRCCKSIGIAEELHWPAWIRKFKREHCRELGKDRWGSIPIVRKDDEAGAKLFLRKMEDDEVYHREPSMVAQFAEHAKRIMTEDEPARATGYVPRPGEEGRDEWDEEGV